MEVVDQLIGRIPDWLPLGPEMEINGVKAREILGDWSHRAECDRPPRYLIEGAHFAGSLKEVDRGPDRPQVKCFRPGKDIAELASTQSGKVAIFFNGPSLGNHSLNEVKLPIVGMNRTHRGWAGYAGPQPDWLCLVDHCWFTGANKQNILQHPKVINGSDHPAAIGYRVPRSSRMKPFSFDLKRDGYVGPVPCTTGHLALQLAVYLGFKELYCLGWDLQGGHFDGTKGSMNLPDAVRYHGRQKEILERAGIKVYLCGSPQSKLASVFEQRPFSEVCA